MSLYYNKDGGEDGGGRYAWDCGVQGATAPRGAPPTTARRSTRSSTRAWWATSGWSRMTSRTCCRCCTYAPATCCTSTVRRRAACSGTLAGGVPCCFTVTLLDGLVLARSAFHHSLNYRSVVVPGDARGVADPDEKARGARAARRARASGTVVRSQGAEPGRAEGHRGDRASTSTRRRRRSAPARQSTPAPTCHCRCGRASFRSPRRWGDPVPDPGCSAPEPAGLSRVSAWTWIAGFSWSSRGARAQDLRVATRPGPAPRAG